jgi:flagella basal body P-ring formation protein FlgA
MRFLPACFAICLTLLITATALAYQEPAPVKKAIEDYLRIQTKGLPGRVSYTVGAIDANNGLPPCSAFDVTSAPGARAWGRTTVAVRCIQAAGWSIFVPVQIRVVADYLVTGRPIAQGQLLMEADVSVQTGDLTDLPTGVLTDVRQAIGRTATASVAAGRPLRSDMLRQAYIVQQGQSVKVVSAGPGFQVANEGRAMNNAAEGQVVQVRLANGQVLSGIARNAGIVEVSY